MLQGLRLVVSPRHLFPPCWAFLWIILFEVRVPPPQVFVQNPQLLQFAHWQSTARGWHELEWATLNFRQIKYIFYINIVILRFDIVIPGQEFVLQGLSLLVSPTQLLPPCRASIWITLFEVWVPPPQVFVQDPHPPHWAHWHSTEIGWHEWDWLTLLFSQII